MTFHNPWPARIAMTVEEASIAAGLGRRTIMRAIEQGKLPSAFVLVGGEFPASLERFMSGLPPIASDAPRMRTVAVSGRGA